MFYIVAISILALFDVVATHYSIVVVGTTDIEVNPIQHFVLQHYGIAGMYIVKAVLTSIGLIVFYKIGKITIEPRAQLMSIWCFRIALIAHVILAAIHLNGTEFFSLHS